MRSLKVFARLLLSVILFALFFAVIVLTVILLSLGILAFPVALAAITGIFTNVASDLSPPAMFLAGIFCVSTGLLLALLTIILFPKQPFIIKKLIKL